MTNVVAACGIYFLVLINVPLAAHFLRKSCLMYACFSLKRPPMLLLSKIECLPYGWFFLNQSTLPTCRHGIRCKLNDLFCWYFWSNGFYYLDNCLVFKQIPLFSTCTVIFFILHCLTLANFTELAPRPIQSISCHFCVSVCWVVCLSPPCNFLTEWNGDFWLKRMFLKLLN